MAVVEDIELRVTVDATGAQKGLDETRKAAETMGGRVGNLTEAFKSLQQKLGPSAAAISGVASALGQTNGEAGKALAAVGQVAAAFAAGGPFGAALAAGTFAVDQLTASWERQIKAQDDALKAQYAQFDAANKTTKQLEDQAAALRLQLEPLSPKELRSRASGQIAELERTIRVNEGLAARDKNRALELRQINTQLERQKALIFEVADLQARMLEKGAARPAGQAKTAAPQALSIAGQLQLDMMAEEEQQLQAARKASLDRKLQLEQAAADARAEAIQNELDLEEKAINWLAQKREEAAQHAIEVKRKEAEETTQITAGVVSVATSAFQQLTTDMITGEEHKAERFAALIMQQAGQALIASGTKLAGEAVVSGLTPGLQPLAAAQGAGAVALIGSGIALGGVATGIMHVAEGGQIGKALPEKSTTDKGGDMAARARPARPGAAGPGGTNLTIIYGGLSGPSADDGARALKKGMKRASVRGMA